MSPERWGNQEANIHSQKKDHNSIFPNKQAAGFDTIRREGGTRKWGEAVSCLISELYLQRTDSHAKEFNWRQEKSLKTSELLTETWEVWPHVKAMTRWRVLATRDIMACLEIHAVLAEIRYPECQMCGAGEHDRGEAGRGCSFQWGGCTRGHRKGGICARMRRSLKQPCFLPGEDCSGKSN